MASAKRFKNPLPPTLREKKRYLAFRLFSEKPLSRRAVAGALSGQVRAFFGDAGAAEAAVALVDWDPPQCKGILSCARAWKARVHAALSLLAQVDGRPVTPKALRASGTLKKLRGHPRPRH